MAIGSAISAAGTVAGTVAQTMGMSAQQDAIYQQQVAVRKQEAEAKSDRMRKANAELGTLRAAELGSVANKNRFGVELGYVTGVDLGRIGANAESQVGSLQSQSEQIGTNITMAWAGAALQLGSTALGFMGDIAQSDALKAAQGAQASSQQHTNDLL